MICDIGLALPTIPTIRPTSASRPDESISIHEGAVPVGVVMVMSHLPTNLTSRPGDGTLCACADASPVMVRPATMKAITRVIVLFSESGVAGPGRLSVVWNARIVTTRRFNVALRLSHSDL